MDSLLQSIGDWIKQGLIDAIMGSFTGMFDAINDQVSAVALQVGQTPEAMSPGVFSMIRTLSETVILPIAGMILTFVLCYELIHMVIDRNNLHDFETWIFFKWIFKTFCAVYILTHTFDIVMSVFALAQNVVSQSAGLLSGSLAIGNAVALDALRAQLEAMDVWSVIGLWMQVSIVSLCITAMSICVFVVAYGRMVEIYLTVSIAPIPLSTMVNREIGSMGQNYLKALFALGFQGFLIMVCIAIYSVLIQGIATADNIHMAIYGCAGVTTLLCFTLFKSASISKALFNAH
jgi:hypothetical protein